MKAVTVKTLKEELKHRSHNDLIDLCLKLSRFKKENKELLTYLLFESQNEEYYIQSVIEEIDSLFEEMNTSSYYYMRKSVRKILTLTKKYIRYSKKKETEVELLLHFCKRLKSLKPTIDKSPRLKKVFITQIGIIQKALKSLHEDLQFDYEQELLDLQ